MKIATQDVCDAQAKRYRWIVVGSNLFIMSAFAVLFVLYLFPPGVRNLPFSQWTERPTLTILVSTTAASESTMFSAYDAMQLALDDVDRTAGGFPLELRYVNNGSGDQGRWDAFYEKRNALIAADDENIIAYIGPNASDAAQISMPILNRAGIAQLSITNTYPGLTREGFRTGEPDIYYPTELRHYFRLVADDTYQASVALRYGNELGLRTIYLVDDGLTYGSGLADQVEVQARGNGMEVLTQQRLLNTSESAALVASKILESGSDMVYYAGTTGGAAGELLAELSYKSYKGKIFSGDGIFSYDFLANTVAGTEGIVVTKGGATLSESATEIGKEFRAHYASKYGREPGALDALAYDAVRLVVKAVEKNGRDRIGIIDFLHSIRAFPGTLGNIEFDANGDIKEKKVQLFEVKDGEYSLIKDVTLQ